MRTVLFLAAGLFLLTGASILAKFFSEAFPSALRWTTLGFISLWLAVTAANMWVGVTKAGYSAAEELPIFALLFGIPVVAALVVRWKMLQVKRRCAMKLFVGLLAALPLLALVA